MRSQLTWCHQSTAPHHESWHGQAEANKSCKDIFWVGAQGQDVYQQTRWLWTQNRSRIISCLMFVQLALILCHLCELHGGWWFCGYPHLSRRNRSILARIIAVQFFFFISEFSFSDCESSLIHFFFCLFHSIPIRLFTRVNYNRSWFFIVPTALSLTGQRAVRSCTVGAQINSRSNRHSISVKQHFFLRIDILLTVYSALT